MYILSLFVISLTTTYLMRRFVRHTPFSRADVAVALYSGLISTVLAQLDQIGGAEWGTLLPLLLAFLLPLGLQAMDDSATVR